MDGIEYVIVCVRMYIRKSVSTYLNTYIHTYVRMAKAINPSSKTPPHLYNIIS